MYGDRRWVGLPTSRARAKVMRLTPTDRCPRDSNPGPLDSKSSILPLSHGPLRPGGGSDAAPGLWVQKPAWLDQVIGTTTRAVKGSMPPSIGDMELLVWMQRADFSEHIQGFKSPGDPLNSSHFDAPNTKSAPTGYRRAPNIISQHYKQQLSAKASIAPKARPIRFR